MSLERKDLRIKLDADVHARLSIVAEAMGHDMSELAERCIAQWVAAEIDRARLIADRLQRAGIAGSGRE